MFQFHVGLYQGVPIGRKVPFFIRRILSKCGTIYTSDHRSIIKHRGRISILSREWTLGSFPWMFRRNVRLFRTTIYFLTIQAVDISMNVEVFRVGRGRLKAFFFQGLRRSRYFYRALHLNRPKFLIMRIVMNKILSFCKGIETCPMSISHFSTLLLYNGPSEFSTVVEHVITNFRVIRLMGFLTL